LGADRFYNGPTMKIKENTPRRVFQSLDYGLFG
jgi:hypothetical protein